MPDRSLLLLLDEVRGKTLRLLGSVPPEHTRRAPPGLQNTILWHAGHAYVVVEALTMRALGQPPRLPEGWFALFGWDSRPAAVPADRWPPLPEVIAQLEAQRERLRRLLGRLEDASLDRPSAGNPDRTVRHAILHALHDEACHSGEIHLLRKLFASEVS